MIIELLKLFDSECKYKNTIFKTNTFKIYPFRRLKKRLAKKQKKKRSKSVTQTHNEDAEASGLDDKADSGSCFWLAA